jgi:hypothetical protein
MPDVLDTEVFYDETFGIWSSPTYVSTLRYPIPVYDMEIPSNIRLRDLRQPRWLTNTYPFIAFWPKSVDFNRPIFSRLDICNRAISVEKAGPLYYQLNSNIITSWSRLERALEGLAKFLLSKGHHKAELGLLPFPRDCGYMSKHREPDFVYPCAYKSRDAFVALSTVCSFAIANLMDKNDHLRDEAIWVKKCHLQGVHPQWLEDLQRSFICNFTPGFWVGAYVNGYLSTWTSHFPAFKTGNAPLLIWWGHDPHPVRDVLMKIYLPRGKRLRRPNLRIGHCQFLSLGKTPTIVKDIRHKRYGFMAEVPYKTDARVKQYKSVANESDNILSALNRIGLKEFREYLLAQAGMDLYNFVAGSGSVPVAFPPLWDVAPTFRDQIQNHSKLCYQKVDDETHLMGYARRHSRRSGISSSSPTLPPYCRCFGRMTWEFWLLYEAYLIGASFNTVRCVDKKPKMTKRMNEKSIGLGYRDKHHRFDRQEHAAYEKRKQDILKKGHGRAARMAGGILWGQAHDVVSEKAVTRGPSTSVSVDGSVLCSMKKFHVVDDALSSSEMDIICGVYFLYAHSLVYDLPTFVTELRNQDSHPVMVAETEYLGDVWVK